jgi:hypothetical protein
LEKTQIIGQSQLVNKQSRGVPPAYLQQQSQNNVAQPNSRQPLLPEIALPKN